jgi:hypothetical protein
MLEFDLFFQLGVGFGLTRLIDRDLAYGIYHRIDDLLNSEYVDLPGLRIDPPPQFFIRLEVLARRDDNGVLDGMNDNLRIDAFLSADLIDRLKKHVRHNVP